MKTMSSPEQAIPFSIPARHHSLQAKVRWGDHVVTVGGDAPVRVQSMTNTDTGDAIGTAIQVKDWRWPAQSWFASQWTPPNLPKLFPTSVNSSTKWTSMCL